MVVSSNTPFIFDFNFKSQKVVVLSIFSSIQLTIL